MNQQIDNDQNTIDRGVSDITSFDLLEQPSEFKTALDESYKVEDEAELGNYPAIENYGTFTTEGALQSAIDTKDFVMDIGKGAFQLGAVDTLGTLNRIMPTSNQEGALGSTADEDYYGILDAPITMFGNALGFGPNQEGKSLEIPYDQYTSNPRFVEHMNELNLVAHSQAAKKIHPGLQNAVLNFQNKADQDSEDYLKSVFKTLYQRATDSNDKDLLQQLDNFNNKTWEVASLDYENQTVTINNLPEIDEGMFGVDLTLDPSFSSKGDLMLPGEGTFGMRDGELVQLASSISRPMDEMFMANEPNNELAQYISDNVTDKLAPQGPEMLPPEGVGIGYYVPQFYGLAKSAAGIGKGVKNFIKGNKNNLIRSEPYIESNMDQGLGSIQQGDLFGNK